MTSKAIAVSCALLRVSVAPNCNNFFLKLWDRHLSINWSHICSSSVSPKTQFSASWKSRTMYWSTVSPLPVSPVEIHAAQMASSLTWSVSVLKMFWTSLPAQCSSKAFFSAGLSTGYPSLQCENNTFHSTIKFTYLQITLLLSSACILSAIVGVLGREKSKEKFGRSGEGREKKGKPLHRSHRRPTTTKFLLETPKDHMQPPPNPLSSSTRLRRRTIRCHLRSDWSYLHLPQTAPRTLD